MKRSLRLLNEDCFPRRLHMTCLIPAYSNKIYSSRYLSPLRPVEGVEGLANFLEYNFIWEKTYGFLPLLPLFGGRTGVAQESAYPPFSYSGFSGFFSSVPFNLRTIFRI